MKAEGINSLNPRDPGLVVNKLDLTFPEIAPSCLPRIRLRSELGGRGKVEPEGTSLDKSLGVLVVGKPFTIISCFCHRWVFGWIGCRWYGWAGFFFGCGSLITMTAVSLDRYLKICYLSYGK